MNHMENSRTGVDEAGWLLGVGEGRGLDSLIVAYIQSDVPEYPSECSPGYVMYTFPSVPNAKEPVPVALEESTV